MKVYVYTLGCRVNQCESEAVAKAFLDAGHEVSGEAAGAALVIVNTCTVTGKAEQKARRMIRLFGKQCPVLVTGCYAQVSPSEIRALGENVYVLPLSRKQELLGLPQFLSRKADLALGQALTEFCAAKQSTGGVFDYAASGFSYHTRSYLKVQDGCDNDCAFCRVHIARGKSSFLDKRTAVERALEIQANGYHEIVLTGVNLTMYDHEGRGLGGLLESLLAAVGPDMRFRLSSLEPDHIDDFLLKQLEDPRMQPYFHIPIQSASDRVIKRINRKYDSKHLDYVVSALRQIKQDPFLACDIITGLPSEEDHDFEITRTFIEEKGFAHVHVFPFSPRPDTPLYKARDRVPESVRDQRALVLRNLSERLNTIYLERQVGRENEVILETRKAGRWEGLSGNYMRLLISDAAPFLSPGDLLRVVVTGPDTARVL